MPHAAVTAITTAVLAHFDREVMPQRRMHAKGRTLMALTFYKAVRLVRRKVWQPAVPDGLRVVEPDEQLAAGLQLEVRQGVQRVAEQDAPFEVVAEEQVGPSLEALAAQLRLRAGQRVRRAELDARFEAAEELAAWPVEGLSVQPVADSGVRFAARRLVPEAVR